jgi:hypothetical protein
MKSSIIDDILNGMTSRAVQGVKDSNKANAKKEQQVQQKPVKKDNSSFLGKAEHVLLKGMDLINRPGNAVRTGVKNELNGNNFLQGLKEGITGQQHTSGTELNKQLGFDPIKNKSQRDVVGTALNLASLASPVKAYPFLSNNAKSAIANNLPGLSTEINTDPLNALGGIGEAGKALSLPRQLSKVLEGTNSAKYSEEAFQNALKAAYSPKGDVSNVVADAVKTTPKANPQEILDQLLSETPNISKPNTVDTTNFGETPTVDIPDVLKNDYGNLSQDELSSLFFPNESKGLDFGSTSKPSARPNLNPVESSADPLNRPQSYWQNRYEDFVKTVADKGYNPNNLSKPAIEELWTQFAKNDEPVSLNQAVDLAYKNVPSQKEFNPEQILNELLASKPKNIKDVLASDPKVAEALAKLDALAPGSKSPKYQLNGDYGQGTVEDPISALEGRTIPNAPTPGLKQTPDEILRSLQNENVNKSQDVSKVIDQLISPENGSKKLTMDELNQLVRGEKPISQDAQGIADVFSGMGSGFKDAASAERMKLLNKNGFLEYKNPAAAKLFREQNPDFTEQIMPDGVHRFYPKSEPNVTSGDKKGLLGVNLQQFNNDIPSIIKDSKPIESVSATDAIKNPIKRAINKFYEGYVNKTHSAKVAHTTILENEIRKLTESGAKPKKLEQLKGQLKFVKKYGSDVEKAIQNESAAGMRAKTFLDGHMENLQSALGSTKPEDMANAIRYQVAKNIKWIWDKVNPDYEIGGGWTKGEINTILNEGVGNQKLENFTKAMKNLTQQRLDFALKYNLINKEAHAALSKNPYYIPMARDVTPGMDNVARGLKGGNTSNKRTAGAYFIQSLGDGDAEALYKDPLETLMSGTFSLFKNMAKSDSEQQLLKMAKMDSDNLFSRVVNKKEFEANGGIAVPTPKGTQYIQLQDDLMKMIKENDLPYDLNVIGKMTSVFAGAKTRSLEYHMTGVPRDLAEGYLKGQTNNPFTYLKEIVKAAKEHNLSAKDAGAYFDKAYKDGMNGINSEKMMKEYARQNKNVKPFNPKSKESWKDLTHTIARIADMPFKPIKAIGQLSDELPRTVEIKATQKAFMKQHGKQINNIKKALEDVNAQIDGASHATDPFDPALQGIDKLKSQKTKLEGMLSEYDKALQRETTYRGRDIMNFSRSGRSGAAKHIRQYMIFANTATQSKDKLIRSFIERPAATIAKTALLTAPLVAAEQVMQQNLSGKDKEIYDNLPSWSKQYNYVFVNNGSVYTLPKIQELALLTDPIEALLSGNKEDLNASARLAVKEAVPYQLGNVAQGLVPNTDGSVTVRKNMQVPSLIASPALDVAANDKLGFNRNAISFADKFGRKNPQANKFTLDLFKKIGWK